MLKQTVQNFFRCDGRIQANAKGTLWGAHPSGREDSGNLKEGGGGNSPSLFINSLYRFQKQMHTGGDSVPGGGLWKRGDGWGGRGEQGQTTSIGRGGGSDEAYYGGSDGRPTAHRHGLRRRSDEYSDDNLQ